MQGVTSSRGVTITTVGRPQTEGRPRGERPTAERATVAGLERAKQEVTAVWRAGDPFMDAEERRQR